MLTAQVAAREAEQARAAAELAAHMRTVLAQDAAAEEADYQASEQRKERDLKHQAFLQSQMSAKEEVKAKARVC